MSIFILIFLIFLAAFIRWLTKRLKHKQRIKVFGETLGAERIEILVKKVAIYSLLPNHLKQGIHGRINIFLKENVFIGQDGLEITDDIKTIIAGNACLLLIGRKQLHFSGFSTILVYPSAYRVKNSSVDKNIHINTEDIRLGESWQGGPVVLSWADTLYDSQNGEDARNVVLHEFAHKLDEDHLPVDGLPSLNSNAEYDEWASVLSREFESLIIRVNGNKNSVIDAYGATSAPEVFAVATESFFEKPRQMKKNIPDLYQQLELFYGLDPESWH